MIGTEGLESQLNQILNDPERMAQILSLAQSFGMSETQPAAPPEAPPRTPDPPNASSMPPLDPAMLQSMMQLMQQAQRADGKQEALLLALKPYLAPERREKLDRAMQIARISHLAGYALRNYGGLPKKGGG